MALQLETPQQAARRIRLQRSRGRELDQRHLNRIKHLPCLRCKVLAGDERASYAQVPPVSEAAHIRLGDVAWGIEHAGIACKPHDWLTLPLCDKCHRTGKHAEHNTGSSRNFWKAVGIDPVEFAMVLYDRSQHEKSDQKAIDAMKQAMEMYLIMRELK